MPKTSAVLVVLAALASSVAALHCSARRAEFTETPDSGPPPPSPFTDAGDPAGPSGDCSDENKQIYVVSSQNKALYRFSPLDLQFTKIGDVLCPTGADTHSMAVDRHGNAWIAFDDGRLFLVSTIDASCKELPFRNTDPSFSRFGMGFAKNVGEEGDASETLFVHGEALGKIDTSTYQLSLVGPTGLGLSELTGTGNGLLYAFVASSGKVAKLDKTTGAIEKQYRTSAIDPEAAWAFAHWGGDFWLFVGRQTSSVTRYSPTYDTSTVVIPDTGMRIIGAGSSTCAPVEPPH